MATLTINVDDDVKAAADKLYKSMGLNLTTAVNAFLRKSLQEGGMPFRLTANARDCWTDPASACAFGRGMGGASGSFANWAGRESGIGEVCSSIACAAKFFPAIRKAVLFGSFARGTQGPTSDVDVRIELDRSIPFNLRDLSQFAKRIEQELGREVDVVSADVIKNESMRQAIEREGMVVYEREE